MDKGKSNNKEPDQEHEINRRAAKSEMDISAGRVKNAQTFKQEFEQWQKKKRDKDGIFLIHRNHSQA